MNCKYESETHDQRDTQLESLQEVVGFFLKLDSDEDFVRVWLSSWNGKTFTVAIPVDKLGFESVESKFRNISKDEKIGVLRLANIIHVRVLCDEVDRE